MQVVLSVIHRVATLIKLRRQIKPYARGYLRGELGDSLEGGFHYLRNGRFTYIVLEFYDDVHDEYFNLGIVFDVFDDGGSITVSYVMPRCRRMNLSLITFRLNIKI